VSKTPVPAELRAQVAADARGRCGYCRAGEDVSCMAFEIEHLKPEASGGRTVRRNLWLACPTCNKRKGKRTRIRVPGLKRVVRLFNLRRDRWTDHFRWLDSGERV
jgi:5-methylcytosine-specific restriction endonuclease McrA